MFDISVLIISLVVLFILVKWHAKTFAYICPKCNCIFTLSALRDLFSPQGFATKYITCPKCKQRGWAKIIKKNRHR